MTVDPGNEGQPQGESVLTIRVRRGHLLILVALAIGVIGFIIGRATAPDEQPVLYGLPAGGAAVSPTPDAVTTPPESSEPVDVETEGSPALGPEDAEVTMVEFIDFQCPFCGAFARDTFPKIKREYGDQVRYVSRAFPLEIHENAEIAALAGYCADQQDSYWELHEMLFADQEQLARPDLIADAKHLGLDVAVFEKCLDSEAAADSVAKDLEDGRSYGVTGTPTFFIDGVPFRGNQPYESLSAAIDDALDASQDSE